MHPAYTLYIGLEARVSEWKNDMCATVNKAFTAPAETRYQVDEKKPIIAEKQVEEGRRDSQQEWIEKK